jgi:hypothetical protein
LAYVVRPALELAGQIAWLLADKFNAERRARRYLVWRLADLRAQRLLLREFRAAQSLTEAAVRELDETESEILASVDAAKWTALQAAGRPREVGGSTEHADEGSASTERPCGCTCAWFEVREQANVIDASDIATARRAQLRELAVL